MEAYMLRIVIVVLGILLLVVTFSNYIKKNLTEKATLMWGFLAVMIILTGAVPALSGWSSKVSDTDFIAPFIILIIVVCFISYTTKEISVLRRKNQELAMHVSLLNQENERILLELTVLTGKDKTQL